jgi:CDP-glucose 4,6-dehydratase
VGVDVCDEDALRDAVHRVRPGVVFHLAGTAVRSPDGGFDVNPRSTRTVLTAVHSLGAPVRVVVASTDALTGQAPEDAYERSKAATEAVVACAGAEWGADAVVARLANVYGPGDRARDRLLPGAATAAAAGRAFEPAQPASLVDLVHVDDAVRALARLSQPTDDALYRIASGVHVTVAAVAGLVRAIAEGEPPPVLEPTPYESPLAFVPGWTPAVALASGLEATVRWYLEHASDEGAD